jgi:SAM-dependent methyltransferase
MSANRIQYWDAFYKERPFAKGKAPNTFLVDSVGRLRKGRVLDLAMGEGVNAVYLAQKGFSVRGFDISPVAVEHAQELARGSNVTIEANAADLDLFLFGMFEYDSIVMTYFKPPLSRYYSELIRSLKQGGTLLVESHTMEEVKDKDNPEDPILDHYFKSNELLHALKGLRILFYNESLVNQHNVVQCLAQKPLEKDAVKYGFATATEPQGPSAQQKLAESLFKKK